MCVSLPPPPQLGGYQWNVSSGSVFRGISAEGNTYLMTYLQLCLFQPLIHYSSPTPPAASLHLFKANVPSCPSQSVHHWNKGSGNIRPDSMQCTITCKDEKKNDYEQLFWVERAFLVETKVVMSDKLDCSPQLGSRRSSSSRSTDRPQGVYL